MANYYLTAPAILRFASTAAAALITITASGVAFKVLKNTPTAAIRSENIIEQKSSSGSGIKVDGYGSETASGHIVQDGNTALGTGYLILNNSNASGSTVCMRNTAGVQRVMTIVNTTVTVRAIVGNECSK